jgi:hypothetical protein
MRSCVTVRFESASAMRVLDFSRVIFARLFEPVRPRNRRARNRPEREWVSQSLADCSPPSEGAVGGEQGWRRRTVLDCGAAESRPVAVV